MQQDIPMATRSTIKIEGVEFAKVHKHWDGSPEATLPSLELFNKDFYENRGDDPTYKFAQLLRRTSMGEHTGWSVVGYEDVWGIDYEYTLHKDGSVSFKEMF